MNDGYRLEDPNTDQDKTDGQDKDTDLEAGNYGQQQGRSGMARGRQSSKRYHLKQSPLVMSQLACWEKTRMLDKRKCFFEFTNDS